MGTWGSGVVGGGEVGGEAADFGDFPHLRCLFALLRGGEAANFSAFPHLRCLLGFLPALKATDFAGFPFLRCLFALLRGGEAANFSHFPHLRCLDAHAPKNEIFRQTHCNPAPGMVQYRVSSYCNTGYHRMFSGMLAWLETSFETLVQSTGMEI